MKTENRVKTNRIVVALLLCSVTFAVTIPGFAQPGRGPHRPPHHYHGPPQHHHHGPSDFDKTMRVLGAVGAVAAIAGGASQYYYYRQQRPVVVVQPAQPTVVVERPVVVDRPVIVDRPVLVEKSVVVEKASPVAVADNYSYRLGATFEIQKMQIPGYRFTAARLTSDPIEGSPLNKIKLKKGDVITRLNTDSVASMDILDRHENYTTIRYIKHGTTKVLIDRIYIPTEDDMQRDVGYGNDVHYAP